MSRRAVWIGWVSWATYVVLRGWSAVDTTVAHSPWRAHGADVLAPLVLVPLFTALQVAWGLRSWQDRLSGRSIVAWVAVFALTFEVLLPRFLPRMVADPIDVLAYAVGGLLLWIALHTPRRSSSMPQRTPSRLRMHPHTPTRTQPLEVAR